METREPSVAQVLRWVYTRDGDTRFCELSLAADDSMYELRSWTAGSSTTTIERYNHVGQAFQRHGAIEGLLIGGGWTLASFVVQEELRLRELSIFS